jgi:hypothetical protein
MQFNGSVMVALLFKETDIRISGKHLHSTTQIITDKITVYISYYTRYSQFIWALHAQLRKCCDCCHPYTLLLIRLSM